MKRQEYKTTISSNGDSEIDLDSIIDVDSDVYDFYVEVDGTVSPAPILVGTLPNDSINFYIKNTNVSNPQGVLVEFLFSNDYADYAFYDDGNISYTSDHIEIVIPRNKVVEVSLKKYYDLNDTPVLSIVYSDPLTIQSISSI